MKKRLLPLLIALVMVFGFVAACGSDTPPAEEPTLAPAEPPADPVQEDPAEPEDTAEEPPADDGSWMDITRPSFEEVTPAGTLSVGTPAMNGDFIYGFGNSSYDKYIKDLTSGYQYYATYTISAEGEIILNSVVVDAMMVEDDEEGNRTYTFRIYDDLMFDDGSPITAANFVFQTLWDASPQWRIAGATSTSGENLVGYAEYNNAEAETEADAGSETDFFYGVKLLNDYEFSMTIDAELLPYIWETSYVMSYPISIDAYAPGASIEANENGTRITGVDLMAAANAVAGGERFAPTVSAGPYSFVSFENQIVTLKVNENFIGDLYGQKPKFEFITQAEVPQDLDVQMVINDEIDLVTGVIEGAKIEAAKAAPNVFDHSYLRAGYGYFGFHCDFGPTADVNLRWGLASLVDRSEVIDYVLGGYGGTVDAEYGLAQWMYQEKRSELASRLQPISFNIEVANEYLDMTDWRFEEDGETPFDAEKANSQGTYLRHNADGEALIMEHLGTEDNEITDVLEIIMVRNAPLAGIQYNFTRGDFAMLLDNFYYGFELGEDRKYHSFNLAVNFTPDFDPYYSSNHSDFAGTWINSLQISDPELDDLIMAMRSLEPDQLDEFADIWVDYQVRYNELMPCLPLYSNQYFDMLNTRVTGINSSPFATWAMTICAFEPAS